MSFHLLGNESASFTRSKDHGTFSKILFTKSVETSKVLFQYFLLLLSFSLPPSSSLSLFLSLSLSSLLPLILSFCPSLSLPPFFSLSPSLSLLPLPSPLHHTQKPLFKGAFFPTQWSKVFAPLWWRLINIPTAASLQGFYFCNSVERSRGHSGKR